MTRGERVVLLLRSLNDLRLECRTWSGSLRRQSVAGEGPSERIECSTCHGDGVVGRRGFPVPCSAEGCGGRGWLFVDAYTRRPIGTAETGVRQEMRAVRCDSCGGDGAFGNERRCGYCGGSGWREVRVSAAGFARVRPALDPLVGDLLTAALDEGFPGAGGAYRERVLAGSYEELRVALEELRAVAMFRYRLVVGTYVEGYQEPEDLGLSMRPLLEQGVAFLVGRMPEVIRVPSWAARNERRRRDVLRAQRRLAA